MSVIFATSVTRPNIPQLQTFRCILRTDTQAIARNRLRDSLLKQAARPER